MLSLPRPSLLGLVSRLHPWLRGTLEYLSEGVVGAVALGILPYACPKSFPGELDRLPAAKGSETRAVVSNMVNDYLPNANGSPLLTIEFTSLKKSNEIRHLFFIRH